ncbi:MAG: taurine ABC transporter permease [Gammaproteobacteria bacterium HGW-Gammaproteobacteria-11]|nr:MAG: taurine ABC transporter permease [Gammaproteobacteria bacterium HGW-Gammaproteobacteria-11]
MKSTSFNVKLAFILPAFLLVLWSLASAFNWVDPRLLPPLKQVVLAPTDPVVLRLVLDGIGSSLSRNIQGALIGSSLGLLFGTLLAFSPIADRMLGPSFHAFRQVAMFAWIPLLTAWLGIGETMRITFIAIAAFKPMVLNTQEGIQSVPRAYIEAGQSMCLSRWQMLRRVVFPSAMPSILAGLQLAFIASWLATVGVETLVSFSLGLGAVLQEGQEHFRMDVVMFGILIIGCVGFVFNSMLKLVADRLLRWRTL